MNHSLPSCNNLSWDLCFLLPLSWAGSVVAGVVGILAGSVLGAGTVVVSTIRGCSMIAGRSPTGACCWMGSVAAVGIAGGAVIGGLTVLASDCFGCSLVGATVVGSTVGAILGVSLWAAKGIPKDGVAKGGAGGKNG